MEVKHEVWLVAKLEDVGFISGYGKLPLATSSISVCSLILLISKILVTIPEKGLTVIISLLFHILAQISPLMNSNSLI